MHRVTFALMRRNLRMLVLAGIAIVVGTAFVSATFLFGNSLGRLLTDSATAPYGNANYMVTASSDTLKSVTLSDAQRISQIQGVSGVRSQGEWDLQLTRADKTAGTSATAGQAADADQASGIVIPAPMGEKGLSPLSLASGRLPARGQIAITRAQAHRLKVRVGDTVSASLISPIGPGDSTGMPAYLRLTVSGITTDPHGAYSISNGAAMMDQNDIVTALRASYLAAEASSAASADDASGNAPASSVDAEQALARAASSRISVSDIDSQVTNLNGIYLRIGRSANGYPQIDPQNATKDVKQALPAGTGSSDRQVVENVEKVLPKDWTVQTRGVLAAQAVSAQFGQQNIIEIFLLTFGVLALLVASLVIANTFQVLVAQRRRTLALLRAVGAKKGQLYRSVLQEANVLGLVSSLIGVALAYLLMMILSVSGGWRRIASATGGQMASGTNLQLVPDWRSVVIPVIFGVLVTILSSISSARMATSVTPLEALRPMPQMPTKKAGIARIVFSLLLLVGGGVLAVASWHGVTSPAIASDSNSADSYLAWLSSAVLACAMLFIGLAISAIWWMPALMRGGAAAVSHIGPASRIAAANVRRAPRRVATTGLALLIGVTLVTTVAPGAATVKQTVENRLSGSYTVDMAADADRLDQSAITRVKKVKGIKDAVLVSQIQNVYLHPDSAADIAHPGKDKNAVTAMIYVISNKDRRRVMRVSSVIVPKGTMLLSSSQIKTSYPVDGQSIKRFRASLRTLGTLDSTTLSIGQTDKSKVNDAQSDADLDYAPLPTKLGTANYSTPNNGTITLLAHPGEIPQSILKNAYAGPSEIWMRLAPGANALQVMTDLQDALGGYSNVNLSGPVAERQMVEQSVNMIMKVLIALIAVSVLIALIGVANTLSLSVIERTRENATLRAIGMTRGQLRRSLAIESLVISVTASIAGLLLGAFFGWFGSVAILTVTVGKVAFIFDWRMALAILVISVIAALISSVAPARRAVRTSPVEVLSEA